jgi:hypothetical protein
MKAGDCGLFWSLIRERVEGGVQTVLELVENEGREVRVFTTTRSFSDTCVSEDGSAICIAGRSVKVFQYSRGELIERFSRDVAADKVRFLGSKFVAVALSDVPWLEVWQLSDGMPTVGAEFAPAPVTALCARGKMVAAGLRSGELLVLGLRGVSEREIKANAILSPIP